MVMIILFLVNFQDLSIKIKLLKIYISKFTIFILTRYFSLIIWPIYFEHYL